MSIGRGVISNGCSDISYSRGSISDGCGGISNDCDGISSGCGVLSDGCGVLISMFAITPLSFQTVPSGVAMVILRSKKVLLSHGCGVTAMPQCSGSQTLGCVTRSAGAIAKGVRS
jgi:hypothetical protein